MRTEIGAIADALRAQFFMDNEEELELFKKYEKVIATRYNESRFKQVIFFLQSITNKTDSVKYLLKLIPMDTIIYFNNSIDDGRVDIVVEQNIFNGKLQYIARGFTDILHVTGTGIVIQLETHKQHITVSQVKLPQLDKECKNTLKEYYEWVTIRATMDVDEVSAVYAKMESSGIETALWYITYNRNKEESNKILGYIISKHHLNGMLHFDKLDIKRDADNNINWFHFRSYSLFNNFYGRTHKFLINYKLYAFWQYLHGIINSPVSCDYIDREVLVITQGQKYIIGNNTAYMVAYVYACLYLKYGHNDMMVHLIDGGMHSLASNCNLDCVGINDLTVVRVNDCIKEIDDAIYSVISNRIKEV